MTKRILVIRFSALIMIFFILVPSLYSFARNTQKHMEIKHNNERFKVTFEFGEVFDSDLVQRLSSGFTTTLLVKAGLVCDKQTLSKNDLQYTIVYDIWEEHYVIQVETKQNVRLVRVRNIDEVLKTCGIIKNLPLICHLSKKNTHASSTCYIEARVEVNPTTSHQRRKVQQYLTNPNGHSSSDSPRSFFGSFARIFVKDKDLQADKVYYYRSQTVKLKVQ